MLLLVQSLLDRAVTPPAEGVALVFERTGAPSTALVFGDDAQITRVDIAIAGTLPGLTVHINLFPPVLVDVIGTLPALTVAVGVRPAQPVLLTGVLTGLQMAVEVEYHTNTQRPVVASLHTYAQVAAVIEGGISQPQQHAQQTTTGAQTGFQKATRANAGSTTGFANAIDSTSQFGSSFEDGVPVQDTVHASMQDGDAQWLRFFSQFQEADRLAAARLTGQFEDGLHDRRISRTAKWDDARQREAVRYQGRAQPALPIKRYLDSLFQDARVPPAGITVWPEPPVVPPAYWGTALVFQCPVLGYPALVFGAQPCYADAPTATVVVPIRRVYIVINSATLTRVDGLVSIPTLQMSMNLDVDSWTWSASASLPGRALEAVQPNVNGDPVEVEAVFNGVPYRFLVESISRDRSFNQSAIRIGMRGKTALLDAPYAPVLNFSNIDDRTMVQLAGDVLTINGVPLGWAVDWTPDAWTVPAGVFSHQGTYISALTTLAAAAGAYIRPHNTAQAFSVLPRYPSAPWAWGVVTPDYELPSAVTVQEGIEWVNRPLYNRVFVSGVAHGVLGQVTRAGTAGDLVATMITDPLITDVLGARQRGLPVLADTGRVANVSLKLPVLPETGIIVPGKMVRYTDGAATRMGITRSVSVSVGANAVDLRQTIAVETHE
jgi:hypothetical protein